MSTPTAELRQRKSGPEEEQTSVTKDSDSADSNVEKESPKRSSSGFHFFDFAFLVAASIVCAIAINHFNMLSTVDRTLITKEELATFDGTSGTSLYIGILGEVYDVSKGERYYGRDQGYYCFVGRDGSKAFVTGKFVDDITDDVTDLTVEQLGELTIWRKFYRDHEEYMLVGRVIGAFYDHRGQATRALKDVEEGGAKAREIKELKEEAKKRNPNCNSKWAQGKGGEIWCTEGYPRLVSEYFPGADPKQRCACFQDKEITERKVLYPNCEPDATRCLMPPKEGEESPTD